MVNFKYTELVNQYSLLIGQALQKTHQYGKALNYYKEAVKDEDNNNLRYDMAELQMRLKTYDRAEKTIQQALELENNGNDLNSLLMQVTLSSDWSMKINTEL